MISGVAFMNLVSDSQVAARLSSLFGTKPDSGAFLDRAETQLKGPNTDALTAEHKSRCKDASLNERDTQSPGKPKCDPVKHPLGCELSFQRPCRARYFEYE